MNLQALIDSTELDMTVDQVKAFFLGVLCADRPLSFGQALEELLSEAPDSKKELEGELKKMWSMLETNSIKELENIFPQEGDVKVFLEKARDQLDYFLTALTLSGTNSDDCEIEEMGEVIEELEDTVMDMDEYLSVSNPASEDSEQLKENLLESWNEFIALRRS